MAELLLTDLGRLIEGRSEEEILAELQQRGVEAVLGQIFAAIAAAFVPEVATGKTAIVQFEVSAPDGVHIYQLKCAGGKCVVQKDTGEAARLTIFLALPDFVRLVVGKFDGMQAFLSGKLRLSGDIMLAQAMPRWFKR